jgi:NAD(P) transhydrogenase subunit alpha
MDSDVIITTAQVFGRRAPILITRDMLAALRPGTVVVDAAVDSGGNVEGVPADQVSDCQGVTVVALANLPGRVPVHASQVFSANLGAFVEEFWDKTASRFVLQLDDEIVRGCLVTHAGDICDPGLKARLGKG